MVEEDNLASLHVAEALGYTDSGARELAGECHLVVQA
jgi:RimJ/RimL family protein N-acetyltransferase